MTNQQVFDLGEIVDSYSADLDITTNEYAANGSVEHIIEYKDKFYRVIASWDNTLIYEPNRKAKTVRRKDVTLI